MLRRAWYLVLPAVLLLTFGGGYLVGAASGPAESDLSQLVTVRSLVQARYLRQVPAGLLQEGAARGMVAALRDPYSAYLSPKEFQAFRAAAEGEFVGVGVTLGAAPGGTAVLDVMPGSPAASAGLEQGALLLQVDGRDVTGRVPGEVSPLIRGAAGTTLLVTVRQGGQVQTFRLVRRKLEMPVVSYKMLPGGVGYLRILQFTSGSGPAVQEGLTALRRSGMRGLVLDLRSDPGGLLSQAVAVAKMLLPAGAICAVENRQGDKVVYRTSGPGLGLPMTVLVDGGTASAAELLAGAIQDRGAGILVGERTFGKGVIQQVFDLPGGGALKLTVARYLTPNGQDINGRGISPQVRISLPPGGRPSENAAVDPQLARAVQVLEGSMRGTGG